MSSIASVCRLAARHAERSVRRKAVSRGFSKSSAPCAAQNFNLPSLSPTMTEGGISSWKVKEGDSFAAGDVLLEIETDKAQMDVEAQEDGQVFKILQQDGAKGIKVGARIAVLAEAGDDLKSLEMPAEESAASSEEAPEKKASAKASESSKQPEKIESAPEAPTPKEDKSSTSTPPTSEKQPAQKYPLYPSVQHLLHTKGISLSDVSKIPASGPSGRLLKGDVLAYLGRIEKSYSSNESKRIKKLGHLDLSNIKKSAPPKARPAQKPAAAAQPPPDLPTEIATPISLAAVFATQRRIQDALGLTLPLSTFIARASEIANEALPRARSAAPSADDLFDAVLGLDKVAQKTSRGRYVPRITALPSVSRATVSRAPSPKKPVDILDILAGPSRSGARKAPAVGAASGPAVVGADNVFSVSVKKGEEKRARVYLERVKTVLEAEPGRCVL